MNKENDYNTVIQILKDGPVEIKGEFVFKDSSGNITKEHKELYICRCGGSANKPFCDGTHKKKGVKN
jgi:3-phenylpropionate/trans-cinnamate dioxygenase ferredoxin subunit